jgi:hypothetical protein
LKQGRQTLNNPSGLSMILARGVGGVFAQGEGKGRNWFEIRGDLPCPHSTTVCDSSCS